MKKYGRIIAALIVVAVLVIAANLLRRASEPESEIIAHEQDRFARSIDRSRADRDEAYARKTTEKLQFLEYQLARAFLKEDKPDRSIEVLRKLINGMDAEDPAQRRAAEYREEARYYGTLVLALQTKHDEEGARKAEEKRRELIITASEASKREAAGEGKLLGSPAD